MKNVGLTIGLLSLVAVMANAQVPDFSENIAPIIYENCTPCHHDGGIAPFPLETYWDAYYERYNIANEIAFGKMPPWTPDTAYQRYAHERVLTLSERNKIINWVNNNSPRGDSTLAPCLPEYADDGILGIPDLKLTIPIYISDATAGSDDYVCFSLSSGLTSSKIVKAVEIVPGNSAIVHHVIIHVDETGTYQTDTSGNCMGPGNATVLGVYAPGSLPTLFVNDQDTKMGVTIPAGSNIVLAMHFPEGSAGEVDSTSVNFYFHPDGDTSIREVSVFTDLIGSVSFCIPADTVMTISFSRPVPEDISLLSVFPHMHLLGKSFIAFVVTSLNDTIPLINIPEWDFEWQDFYTFKNIIKIPAGSTVYADATYDNTVNNHHNPNDPPQIMCAGLNTTDEMFFLGVQFTRYQNGDENIDMENLHSPPQPTISSMEATTICAGDFITLKTNLEFSSYKWCPGGQTTRNITVNSRGAYYVNVTENNGISGNSNTIVIRVDTPVKPIITRVGSVLVAYASTSTVGTTYIWKLNGGNIGSNTQTLEPGISGHYTVIMTDGNGCSKESDIYVVQLPWNTVTLRSNSIANEIKFQVFPNPVSGYLYLKPPSANTEAMKVLLLDSQNRTVIKLIKKGNELIKVPISGLVPGIYFLNIQSDQWGYCQKVVVCNIK